jgi:hypothetical protein
MHATLGGRTLKTGQSRWFVGYKKHTLRLWLPTAHPSVTLVPLVSWITPANVAEGGLLRPSLHWCRQHLGWWPGIVVADMGYLSAPGKQAARKGWQCAVVTKLRADMKLVPPYVNATRVECPQGQRLEWWEFEPASGQQWFRVPAEPELCAHCWQAADCPGHFGYAAGTCTRRCWDCCHWPAAWRNGCCGKCARGSNPRNLLRKTSWAWGRCFSTVCG